MNYLAHNLSDELIRLLLERILLLDERVDEMHAFTPRIILELVGWDDLYQDIHILQPLRYFVSRGMGTQFKDLIHVTVYCFV